MVTLVGSASSPEIPTVDGTGQGGSALPSHLDTMSQPGMTKYDVTAELFREQFKEKLLFLLIMCVNTYFTSNCYGLNGHFRSFVREHENCPALSL